MQFTAKQLSHILGGKVDGDPDATVTGFAKIENGKPGKLCFFANPKYEQYVYQTKATILLVNKDFEPKQPVSATMVRVDDAYTAVADLLKYVSSGNNVHKRHRGRHSVWHFSTKFGKRVWLGNLCSVGRNVTIGDDTIIYDNVTIGDGTVIGRNCILYPGVRIYPGMVIGNNVILHANCVVGSDGFGNAPQPDGTWEKIEHLGKVIIGDNVELGACTTVDRAEMEATVIGNGVKIDNLCQIAHNVVIGDNTVMAAMTGIAGSAELGKNCILAGQVGVVGHIKIADNTTVTAQAGVIGSVRKSGQVLSGMPAIPHATFLRSYAKFKRAGEGEQ